MAIEKGLVSIIYLPQVKDQPVILLCILFHRDRDNHLHPVPGEPVITREALLLPYSQRGDIMPPVFVLCRVNILRFVTRKEFPLSRHYTLCPGSCCQQQHCHYDSDNFLHSHNHLYILFLLCPDFRNYPNLTKKSDLSRTLQVIPQPQELLKPDLYFLP